MRNIEEIIDCPCCASPCEEHEGYFENELGESEYRIIQCTNKDCQWNELEEY